MFNFTPLLGAQSDSPASQSLVELDGGVKLLVDVGWDETFDVDKLHALEKHVSTLSVILLTHPTLDHIGAYAHCCKHIALFSRIPVYATNPVINLGRTLLADLYASSPLASSIIPAAAIGSSADGAPNLLLQPPTADEITTYFNRIHPLKYSQPHQPIPSPWSPSIGNLSITAYCAGHTPGGTIWHIQHSMESIVYAADWNLSRENLLSGAAWLGNGSEIIEPLRRPTALVCSSKGIEKTDVLPRKKRDEALISLIRETIVHGGKVLVPTDSSARVLELAFILNSTWQENINGPHAEVYKQARIYMASGSSTSTVRQLQSMLEWMDENIIRDAEAAMNQDQGGDRKIPNLLDWKHVKQIERQSQFDRAIRRSRPGIFLASDASLEWGFSKQALEKLAGDSRNLVILTEDASSAKGAHSTIAKQLADCYNGQASLLSQSTSAKVVNTSGQSLLLRNAAPSPLSTDETTLYEQYIARQRQLHSNLQGDDSTNDGTANEIADEQAEESSDDEDEDEEQQGRALNASAQMQQTNKRKAALSDAELGINVLLKSKNVHDFDVRNKRGREKMFPYLPHRTKSDAFGEIIRPEDYLRAEEREDVDGVDMRDGIKQEAAAVGQKRKWDELAATTNAKSKGQKKEKADQNKKPKVEREPDDIDALIARATGEGDPTSGGANGAVSEESGSDSDYEPEDVASEGPQKVVFTEQTIELQLRIAHIDFTGLHERRDLSMIIPLVRPRNLILISGTTSETQALAEEARQLLSGEGGESESCVFSPLVGEMVDASVDTNAWTLMLSRELVKKLTWQNVKGLGVVALTGRLDVLPIEQPDAEEETAKKKVKLTEGGKTASEDERKHVPAIPVLDLINTASTASQRATQPVHVGDLRLAEFRKMMLGLGHTADFRGEGTLLIDGTVVVRKSATGRIEVEASGLGLLQPQFRTRDMEGSFFAVRKAIYGGLGVVSGV
ncbi:Metallo-hydrolase oxidoreductase [Lecanosticta acicola]|uniref:Cleavage and polyadenylation specificity factor subunit 2 n=1 Tax=Lecanosticta acicola TaxID=111012 RepID=A0AAI9EBB3_9PEZI|nr:Metallo-hydrolase oxidoreductase [Lecanosticta acicola]